MEVVNSFKKIDNYRGSWRHDTQVYLTIVASHHNKFQAAV